MLEQMDSIIDQPAKPYILPDPVELSSDGATSEDARNVREARDAMQAFAFFSAAIAGQMSELYDKLAHVEVATSNDEFYSRLAGVEQERDQARSEADMLRHQVQDLEVAGRRVRDEADRQLSHMRDELERQRISFADHHAAKQEISRLRAEVDRLRTDESSSGSEQYGQTQGRRWRLGR